MNLHEEISRQQELMGTNPLDSLRNFLSNEFHLDKIIEPNTVPLKSGYVRLYHQTDKEHFDKIKQEQSININYSTGQRNSEPMCVWGVYADNSPTKGFYGEVTKRYTIEYQVPKIDTEAGRVCRSIAPDEIIAYHDPNLYNIRSIISDDDYLSVLSDNPEKYANDQSWAKADGENEHAYYLIANAILKYHTQKSAINEGIFNLFKKNNKNAKIPNEFPNETPQQEQSYFDVFLSNIQDDTYGLPIMFSVLSHGFTSNNKYGNTKTNYYSFDVRNDYEIMTLIQNRKSFIKTTTYKNKKYKVAGIALDTSNEDVYNYSRQQRWVGGREGYAFAIIEDSPEVVNYITQKIPDDNIDNILINEAVKSIKHYFTYIKNWDGAIKMP